MDLCGGIDQLDTNILKLRRHCWWSAIIFVLRRQGAMTRTIRLVTRDWPSTSDARTFVDYIVRSIQSHSGYRELPQP
jgi:hypothetical protein